jgi:uncharacterized protein (DUF2236 family)
MAVDVGSTTTDEIDHGLFGPASVTWRVQLEPVLWVAGMRALLLQSLHPQVMRGTFQNSALFDPKKAWPRFQRTVGFVGTRTFGSHADVEAAGARVRRMHATLRGRHADGSSFALDDPENLLWVHNAEIDSYVDVARRAGVVDDAEADAYVAESVRAAEVVGLDPARVPASRSELAAYFDRVRPQLRLTDEARRGVGGLLTPQPSAPTGIALALSSLAAISFTTLPRWARRMYGLPGLPTTDLGVTVALKVLRTASDLLPDLPAPPEIARARQLVREARAGG